MSRKETTKAGRRPTPGLDAALDRLLAETESPAGVMGPGGLLQQLTGRLMERILKGELSAHLGYGPGEAPPEDEPNRRNGTSPKTVLTGNGAVQIGVPRDREGSFEPQLVARHQRRLPDFDERVLGLYARGLSVREVKSFLEDQYKTDVSADLISRVTDAVSDDVIEWQNRPLNGLYPVVYLDAIHVKMRQDRVVRSRAFYVVLAINMEGHKEVLGLWSSDNEGAAFWLGVLTELKNRGLNDILVACCDGLSGLPEAIRTAFPNTIVQTCVVHKIRASLKYVNWKERKAVARDLKPIYRAATEEAGLAALDDFDKLWGKTYPTIAPSWRRDWDLISPFFEFPEEIRRVIYTTNTIEALNRQLRKVIKTRGVFPTEKAVMKVMYLAIHQAVRKWSMPVKDWGSAMQQFAIRFEGRVNL